MSVAGGLNVFTLYIIIRKKVFGISKTSSWCKKFPAIFHVTFTNTRSVCSVVVITPDFENSLKVSGNPSSNLGKTSIFCLFPPLVDITYFIGQFDVLF